MSIKTMPVSMNQRAGNLGKVDFWIFLIFLVAVVMRGIHYFGRSSMWLDELASAFNITERSFYQLATETLDFNQVAPLGFLWLQKLATLIFGVNDHAFRFFPFVLSLFSLFLFLTVARTFLKGITLIGSFALFSLSMAMIFYGGEAKQYSGDVAAALFLVWSSLKLQEGKLSTAMLFLVSIGGFVLIFCSLPAVVIAPTVLLPVLVGLVRKKTDLPSGQFLIVTTSWALSCALLTFYAKFVISSDVQQAMSDYWSRGFAPLTGLTDFLLWIPQRTMEELSFSLSWFAGDDIPQLRYIALALMILSIAGIVFIFKANTGQAMVLLTPFLIAVLLAIFRLLPFDGRVSIYATWPLIITGMAGITALAQWLPKLVRPVLSAILTLVLALPIGILLIAVPLMRPPYNGQSAQPVLSELKKQMQPGDIIYVYFKSRYALRFYGPKEGISDYVAGRGYKTVEPILRDIDSLRGNKRVWFFFTQWTPRQPFPDSIKSYMGSVIGKQIGVIPDPDGNTGEVEAAAHLYDLSGGQ